MDSQSRVTTCSISITLRMPALLLAFLEVAKDGPDTLLHQAIIATSLRSQWGLIRKITAKEKGVSVGTVLIVALAGQRRSRDYYSTQRDRCNRFLHRFLPGSLILFRYPILSKILDFFRRSGGHPKTGTISNRPLLSDEAKEGSRHPDGEVKVAASASGDARFFQGPPAGDRSRPLQSKRPRLSPIGSRTPRF